MGTRNLTVVQHKGEYKVAQYGQWDGYPSGQGSTVLSFLHLTEGGLDYYRQRLESVSFLTQDEYDAITKVQGWSEIRKELSRDLIAKILWYIGTEGVTELYNSIDFAHDSLFCEWAYVVDLDAEVFEVYKGFNKESITEGRFTGEAVKCHPSATNAYGPVKLIKSYPLAELPTVEQFILDCDPPTEDCSNCGGNGLTQIGTPEEAACTHCSGKGRVIQGKL